MSWFTEIAGKAEDLLNRVDQTAATALQNKPKASSNSINLTPGSADFHVSCNNTKTYHSISKNSVTQTIQDNYSGSKTRYSHRPEVSSLGALSPMKKPESDDEKLIRYLNCNETLPASRKSRSSPVLLVEEDAPQNSISKEERDISPKLKDNMAEDCNAETTNLAISSSLPKIPNVDDYPNSKEESQSTEPIALEKESYEMDKDEILLAKKHAEHSQAEMKRMQRKLEHWNSQITENDKVVFELREREKDLLAAIDAKDSQLAILKVRLQEADQDLVSKIGMINDLKMENERIIKDHVEGTLFQNRTLENLREQTNHLESELIKVNEAYRLTQSENMQRMTNFEEEHRHLAANYTCLQKKWSDVNERNKDLLLQYRNISGNFETIQQEYSEYKQKAQRILQSKEKLISSLKEGFFDADQTDRNDASSALLVAEMEGVKQERDLLKEELRQATELAESLRIELQEVEKISQKDLTASREQLHVLKDKLQMEQLQKEEFQLLNNQLKEELQFLKEDFSNNQTSLKTCIQDREIEIEKLRRQLTAKCLSSVSEKELESRLHALTENLIQKQTMVEALGTEKNSLVLQLERLQQQLKESQRFGSQHHTYVGVNNAEPGKTRSVAFENPFDSSLTQKVRKVYGSIDAFSIRLGVFFRRYPFTRFFVIIYMLLLHLWVMVVLLTYEPEVHNSSYEIIKKQ